VLSPYDWQESVSQRAQYIENRLKGGSPIVGLAIEEGTLLYTYRRHVRKIYEIYDRLMFSAIGQQADVEAMRVTAIDFAHQEGFARSESDVTIGRVVGFALSSPLKRAFGDVTTAPFVIHALFAEMADAPKNDLFMTLVYDGDFTAHRNYAVAAGTLDAEKRMIEVLKAEYRADMSQAEALQLADKAWRIGADLDANGEPDPELLEGSHPEIGFLDRASNRERRFVLREGR
jgi:proteasome alpha subunit